MSDDLKNRLDDVSAKISSYKQANFEKDEPLKRELRGEAVIAELIAGIAFGLFMGYFLDDYFDTAPLFLLILIILGLAGSFYNIYKNAVRYDSDDKNDENKT